MKTLLSTAYNISLIGNFIHFVVKVRLQKNIGNTYLSPLMEYSRIHRQLFITSELCEVEHRSGRQALHLLLEKQSMMTSMTTRII